MKYFSFATVLALAFILSTAQAQAAVVAHDVHYQDGKTSLTGYFAYDDAAKKSMPGILVAPAWWGSDDYAKSRARMLAKLGYAAFVIDMYDNDAQATTPAAAQKLSKPFYDDRALMRSRALAALAALKAQPHVDITRMAAVGYCFGGAVVLELARAGTPLLGVVSFHGNLATSMPAKAGEVKAQILALGGADDAFVSKQEKKAFQQEMVKARVVLTMKEYKGATHAFTNPAATALGKKFNLPIAYNKAADEQSWALMEKFLARVLAPQPSVPARAPVSSPHKKSRP